MSNPGVDIPAYIVLAFLGVLIALWGVQLKRILVSLVFGGLLGYLAWRYTYLAWNSILISLFFFFAGLLAGLIIGFALFRLVISLTASFFLAHMITSDSTLQLVLLVVLTPVFYVVSTIILPGVYAVTGALIIYTSLVVLGLNPTLAILVSTVVGTIGFYNQWKSLHKRHN